MKKMFLAAAASASLLVSLSSCSPEIKIKANADESVEISFRTGFSKSASMTIKSIAGIPEDKPLFEPSDMSTFLLNAGATGVGARTPSETEVEASGTIKKLGSSAFRATDILSLGTNSILDKKNGSSLSLTLGPKEIRKLYALLDDDSKAYLDTMMIPALIGEVMGESEYQLLLSAMYGPSFADELVNGNVTILLESPNGKKTKIAEKLGKILTATEEQKWSVEW